MKFFQKDTQKYDYEQLNSFCLELESKCKKLETTNFELIQIIKDLEKSDEKIKTITINDINEIKDKYDKLSNKYYHDNIIINEKLKENKFLKISDIIIYTGIIIIVQFFILLHFKILYDQELKNKLH